MVGLSIYDLPGLDQPKGGWATLLLVGLLLLVWFLVGLLLLVSSTQRKENNHKICDARRAWNGIFQVPNTWKPAQARTFSYFLSGLVRSKVQSLPTLEVSLTLGPETKA